MADYPVEIPQLPSERAIEQLVSLLEPSSRIIQSKLYGVEHRPGDGSLLVGNHTIYVFLDLPFMMAEIWKRRRLAIRGLIPGLCVRFPDVTADEGARRPFRGSSLDAIASAKYRLRAAAGPVGWLRKSVAKDIRAPGPTMSGALRPPTRCSARPARRARSCAAEPVLARAIPRGPCVRTTLSITSGASRRGGEPSSRDLRYLRGRIVVPVGAPVTGRVGSSPAVGGP
jgi:hypothetical protein